MNMWKLIVLVAALTLAASAKVTRQPELDRSARARSKVRFPRTQVLGDLFDVYDSTFLAHVWPKLRNGMHVNVGPGCWEDMAVFYKDLLEGKLWAYTVTDASGRYQPGIFEGNRHWLGSKHGCLALNKPKLEQYKNDATKSNTEDFLSAMRKEKYFDNSPEGEWHSLAQRRDPPPPQEPAATAPFKLAYHSVAIAMNITKAGMAKSYDITLGLCMPQACAPEDTLAILDFSIMVNDHLRTNRTIPRSVLISRVRVLEERYNLREDTTALVLIFFTLSVFCLTLIATAVDFDLIRIKTRNFRSMSFDLQKANVNMTVGNEKSNNNTIEIHKKFQYEVPKVVLPKKEMNQVNMETLTINNMKNSNQINLVTVKKLLKPDPKPPSITLDVIAVDEPKHHSCHRCGKYRRQCANPRKLDHAPCPRMSYNSFASFSSDNRSCKKTVFLKSVLLCFSLRYSWRKICNTNLTSRDLSAVHALKVLATFWIVFVHVAMVVYYLSADGGDINENNSTYYILSTGTLAFDTLIFVSGVLSSHHFFFLRRRYSLRELVGVGGGCGHALQCVCFITNRAVRLVPPYALAVFAAGVSARAAAGTAPVDLPGADVTCDRHWWRNLLYVSNLYPSDERCMAVSWFLTLETQLHAAATLILVATGRRGGATAAAALLVVMATGAADVIGAWPGRIVHWSDGFAAYALLVERPWARATPYVLGVATGWLVHRRDGRLPLSKFNSFCLWLSSLLILGAVFARPWLLRRGPLDSGLAAISHGLWTAALLWPTLALATKYSGASRSVFDNRPTAALSRLSYGCLLLHGALAHGLLAPLGAPLSVRPAMLWAYHAGVSSAALLASLALSLLVETPCCSLLRRLSDCAAN